MIQTNNLQKMFGSFHALQGINLHVKKGEIYGFLGHNGAGKSTTMNILAALSKPDGGTCQVNGWDIAKIAHPGDLHIGYLPEEPRFYPWLTGRETLQFLGSRWQGKSIKKRVDELLDWIRLEHAANRRVVGYSRGMKQRLGMAAALLYDPDLLLLDEPSSALDPEGRSDVLHLILDLKSKGKTVFLSTHILSDAERVCDRVGILANGKMIVEKPLQTLLRENVSSVYDVVFHRTICSDVRSTLEKLPGIQNIEVHEKKLAIWVSSPEVSGQALLSSLANMNVRVEQFTLRRPSLEDIFLEEVSKNGH